MGEPKLTMTMTELKRKMFCNSADLTKIIAHGWVHEWVGIGLVECGEATEEDRKKYPTIIEG